MDVLGAISSLLRRALEGRKGRGCRRDRMSYGGPNLACSEFPVEIPERRRLALSGRRRGTDRVFRNGRQVWQL